MDRSHTTAIADPVAPAANLKPATDADDQARQLCLTRRQGWLAWATAIAVLLSGLNASVQVVKIILDHPGQSAAQRPHPADTRKPFYKDEPPAMSGGRGLRK